MAEILTLLLEWWALFLVAIFGVGVVLFLGGKMLAKLKLFRKAGPSVVVLAAVAIIYGGTKNITNRFAADPGLTVTNAELTVPTNDVDNAILTCSWIGPDKAQQLHVRESIHETWGLLGMEWLFDGRLYENGTNTVTWWVAAPASNILPHAMYYLGDDLPPVEIDGEGVTIEEFLPTSKGVTIRYAVNPSALGDSGGAVSIEKQGTDDVWMELYRLSIAQPVTNTVTFPGFWVGERTRWRVRLEVNP